MTIMRAVLATIIVLLASYGARAGVVRFPGIAHQSMSPDGKYILLNIDHDRPPYHTLNLRNQINGSESEILSYSRHIEISWAQNSRVYFINNYSNSDISDCIVRDVYAGLQVGSFRNILIREGIISRRVSAGHLYISCLRWLNPGRISLLIRGYNSETAVDRHIEADLQDGNIHILDN